VGYSTFDDLTEIERRLVDAVMNGEQLDLVVPDEEISPEAMTGWGQVVQAGAVDLRHLGQDRFGDAAVVGVGAAP
jgi:hypothetical protein